MPPLRSSFFYLLMLTFSLLPNKRMTHLTVLQNHETAHIFSTSIAIKIGHLKCFWQYDNVHRIEDAYKDSPCFCHCRWDLKYTSVSRIMIYSFENYCLVLHPLVSVIWVRSRLTWSEDNICMSRAKLNKVCLIASPARWPLLVSIFCFLSVSVFCLFCFFNCNFLSSSFPLN